MRLKNPILRRMIGALWLSSASWPSCRPRLFVPMLMWRIPNPKIASETSTLAHAIHCLEPNLGLSTMPPFPPSSFSCLPLAAAVEVELDLLVLVALP